MLKFLNEVNIAPVQEKRDEIEGDLRLLRFTVCLNFLSFQLCNLRLFCHLIKLNRALREDKKNNVKKTIQDILWMNRNRAA